MPCFALASNCFKLVASLFVLADRSRPATPIWFLVAMTITFCGLPVQNVPAAEKVDVASARTKALEFLSAAQAGDGSWTASNALGISGLVVYSMLESGGDIDHPAIKKGLDFLEKFVQPDGGLYQPQSHHSNYETAICLMALAAANEDGRYSERIAAAEKFVRGVQWDTSEGIDESDPKFGGAGYGKTGDRPDLSNTLFFLEALEASGASSDDPAVQNALVFLSRCQNLESEHNTTPFAAKVNDGGFYYTPAAGGNSQAGNTPEGGLRSYGSMTYAGLKSMVFAGLTPDDPRVKAAYEWTQKFYTLAENPGMGQQGIWYYYMVMAKALDTLDVDTIADASGTSHSWRAELQAEILSKQSSNGSWVNPTPRWLEGDPNLATAYALIALAHTVDESSDSP
jgi:Squalene-hopene cyclase C-terminal domain